MSHYALIMLAAGIGIPTLAALNAELGRIMGSPAAAAAILFTVALVVAGLAALVTGQVDSRWQNSVRRWVLFAWLFLAIGLILGGLWAYEELG